MPDSKTNKKNLFKEVMRETAPFEAIQKALDKKISPIGVEGLSGIHKAQLILSLENSEKVWLAVSEDEPAARRLCDDINAMSGETTAAFYPSREYVFRHTEGVSREYEHMRTDTLYKAQNGICRIISASAEAVLQSVIPPQVLKEYTIILREGGEVKTDTLAKKLIQSGYTRAEKVEGVSQFSIRGDIIDIYPIQEKLPVRIELWGDEIDSISFFDTETQRRTDRISEICIPPAQENLTDNSIMIEKLDLLRVGVRGKKSPQICEMIDSDISKLKSGINLSDIDKYSAIIYDTVYTIFDYLSGGIIFNEYNAISERMKGTFRQYEEDIKILLEEGIFCGMMEGFIIEGKEFRRRAEEKQAVYLSTFLQGLGRTDYKKLVSFNASQLSHWGGEIRQLAEDLSAYCKNGYKTILMAGSEKTLPIIAEDLRESGIPCDIYGQVTERIAGRVLLMTGSVSGGYDYPDTKSALITQVRTVSTAHKAKKKKKGEEIRTLSDISAGDLVVHSLHGIGRFAGIKKLELEGVTKDYITIQYDGKDVLYVPVTQLDMVSRYIGSRDETGVKLSKLSSAEWQKTKSRVRKAVKDMAAELVKLYAKREQAKGYAFSKDDEFQREFESRFPYVETDDQLNSIEEIKNDMQKSRPMDRLLCGDVGFGKTEVAFRAAFKCVNDGKQCAILVPTTVLAWQHYQTALRRFEQFPVKIEILSRYRTPKQQQQIIKDLKHGEIDIIIGTHRLVQKDVEFLNLGLAIIDEEQRFGVAHKEKFKKAFEGIDVLTLSATPIPRTLNMAMSGIRDMSVIEEPPQDRYPVQTYVIEHNMGIIIQAISRELKRGGQVYYIHNRIESIKSCAAKLQELLPDARIAFAHGQTSEEEMSETWRKLVDGETDILVSTTIIETGVDVPNVNTLIIEDADNFGLSQLYQLRGRVGRSNRRAYAYFTFKRGKILSEVAEKRLNAIREFTKFGSGFRIALRDLEIRGAGSILGGQQHGHMETVGYDMYLKLLSEAVALEKGETPPPQTAECTVDIRIDAHIPERYIASLAQRIDIYKKISGISTQEEAFEITDELIDRYGEPPKAVMGLIETALLRNTAASIGISEIAQRNGQLIFYVKSLSMEQIQILSNTFKDRLLLNSQNKPYIGIKMKSADKPLVLMKEVIGIMKNV